MVRELQRRADRVGVHERLVVAWLAAHHQDQPPDGVGASPAVVDELLPGVVALHDLVLLERLDEVVEGLDGQVVPLDRRSQGDEHGVARGPVEALLELTPPPGEQLQRTLGVSDLVAEIVGPPAEGVHGGEVVPQVPRHEPAEHCEVLVAAPGKATAPGPGLLDRERLTPIRAVGLELLYGADAHRTPTGILGFPAVANHTRAFFKAHTVSARRRGGQSVGAARTPVSCSVGFSYDLPPPAMAKT